MGIAFLQETHFRSDHIPNIQNRYYPTWYQDTYTYSKSRGVSITIHKSIPHHIKETWSNHDGRALLLKVIIYGKNIHINIYLPNVDQIKVGTQLLINLMERAEGVIIGGDFNFVFDQEMDTTASSIPHLSTDEKKFRDMLEKHPLVDIWRVSHPTEKDYTFHSKVHGTYHRLDYFLINQLGMATVPSTQNKVALCGQTTPPYFW